MPGDPKGSADAMRKAAAVFTLVLAAGAPLAVGQRATDALTESGGLPAVYDQLAPPTRLGGGPQGAYEIQYDDGHLANAWYFDDRRSKYAVRMDPPFHPAVLAQCDIHVLTTGDPYWPWPDSHHDSIYIEVWVDRNGDGLPDFPEVWGAWSQSKSVAPDSATVTVRPPRGSLVFQTGSLWVGTMMDTLAEHPGAGYEGVGVDAATNYPSNQFHYWPPNGGWQMGSCWWGDFMFRAWVTPDSAPYYFGAEVLTPNRSMNIAVGDTVIPRAQVTNFGVARESAWVWMRI